MKYIRVHSDENGVSHFAELEMRLAPLVLSVSTPALEACEPQAASQVLFVRLAPDWSSDWHPAPAYQFVCLLSGRAELTVGNGDTRQFSAGDVLHLQDITGKGHTTRVIGGEEVLLAVIQQA